MVRTFLSRVRTRVSTKAIILSCAAILFCVTSYAMYRKISRDRSENYLIFDRGCITQIGQDCEIQLQEEIIGKNKNSSSQFIESLKEEVVSIDCSGCNLQDSDLFHLNVFNELRAISIRDNQISDDGFALIEKTSHVTTLDISGTNISDKSIPIIQRMPKLKIISVFKTHISPEGVAALKKTIPGITIFTESRVIIRIL